jgi:hypothetical protein
LSMQPLRAIAICPFNYCFVIRKCVRFLSEHFLQKDNWSIDALVIRIGRRAELARRFWILSWVSFWTRSKI